MAIHAILTFSRHGKIRLKQWYATHYTTKERTKWQNDILSSVLARKSAMCNVLEMTGLKVIYRRYASLYFALLVDWDDNELIHLETIHRLVECLDAFFQNVCELDIIFGYEQAYQILNEVIIGGQLQESSKRSVMSAIRRAQEFEAEDEMAELNGGNQLHHQRSLSPGRRVPRG